MSAGFNKSACAESPFEIPQERIIVNQFLLVTIAEVIQRDNLMASL
jgi:hypothetical protein